MSLKNDQERSNTQVKLDRLAKRHEALSAEIGGDGELRDLAMESLKRTMNQLQEEIVLYDTRNRVAGEARHG